MKDKDFLKLLDDALLSDDAPPLTDAEVDAFMSVPVKSSPTTLRRMRKRFVDKVLSELYPEPIRSLDRNLSFGQWIEAERVRARLSRRAVAEAIDEDETFVERLEKETVLPWKLPVGVIADVVILFRIHINAAAQLLSYSYATDIERKQRLASPLVQDRRAPASDIRALILDDQPIDSDSSSDEPPVRSEMIMDEEVTRFLSKLRKALETRRATDLL